VIAWSFPFRVDARGRSALADADAHARELIEQVLFTAPGERVLRPEFGSGIHQLLFAPAGDALAAATEASVRAALQRWLADVVEVADVSVGHDEARVTVQVAYRVLATGRRATTALSGPGGAAP
jgi:phage baseplate assembly protein W